MKQYRILLAIAALVLASMACQTVVGGRDQAPTAPSIDNNQTQPEDVQPAVPTTEDNSDPATTSSDFPMTADAYNLVEVGDGSIVYYTKLSLEEAMEFYRDEYTSMGYSEREILTVVASGTFSIVFDGDPSGKAVVIQSVDLGDGSRTIAIRLEDV